MYCPPAPWASLEESSAHLTPSLPDKHPDTHPRVSSQASSMFAHPVTLSPGPGSSAAEPKALSKEQNLLKCLVVPYSFSLTSYHQSPSTPWLLVPV